MSNKNRIMQLSQRRTQLLDELWDLDKELTRLEAIERAALGVNVTSRRVCAGCGQRRGACRQSRGKWLCSLCRGNARHREQSGRSDQIARP